MDDSDLPTRTGPLEQPDSNSETRRMQGASDPAATNFPRPFGRYTLLREVGRGGMGLVFEAIDNQLDRRVALKSLAEGNGDEESVERFQREARAVARLRHPNIVAIHDVGEINCVPYLTMDFIQGSTFADLLMDSSSAGKGEERKIEVFRRNIGILRCVAHAVGAAHAQGIVHRDLKPGNVMVDEKGVPYVTDFGLAKDVRLGPDGDKTPSITATGTLLGTPAYMSPEQARGDSMKVSVRSDVFSMGVMLYEILCEVPPFNGPSLYQLLDAIAKSDPIPPRRVSPGVPKDLETVCLKCLEKAPDRRYADGQAVAADLDRYLEGEAILARRSGLFTRVRRRTNRNRPAAISLAALVIVLATMATWLSLRRAERVREGEAFLGAAAIAMQAREYDDALSKLRLAQDRLGDRRDVLAEIAAAERHKRDARASSEEEQGQTDEEQDQDHVLAAAGQDLSAAYADLAKGDLPAAIKAIEHAQDGVRKAEGSGSEGYLIRETRGLCLLRFWQARDPRGDLAEAAREFEGALAERPTHVASLQGLVESRLSEFRESWTRRPGQWSEEGGRLTVTWERWAGSDGAVGAIATACRPRLSRVEPAEQELDSTDSARMRWVRGALLASEGKAREALEQLKDVESPTDLAASARQLEGECLLFLEGKTEEAVQRFEAAQRKGGDAPLLLAELGQAQAAEQEWEGASNAWGDLVEARTDVPVWRAELGLALIESDQGEKGKRCLSQALTDGLPAGPLRSLVESRLK